MEEEDALVLEIADGEDLGGVRHGDAPAGRVAREGVPMARPRGEGVEEVIVCGRRRGVSQTTMFLCGLSGHGGPGGRMEVEKVHITARLTPGSPVGKPGCAERGIEPGLQVRVLFEMVGPCGNGLVGVSDVVSVGAWIVWRD